MTEWAEPIRKVTALITRLGLYGPELLVFEHPAGVIQVPAGTVDEDETFEAAARREAWEETGALGLRLVRNIGRVGGVRGPLLSAPRSYEGSVGALACDVMVDGRLFTRGWRVDLHVIEGDDADVTIWGGTAALVPTRHIARRYERQLFHFHCMVEMPPDWYVVTPDGQGVTWRCHWISLDTASRVVTATQREWIEVAYDELIGDPAPPPVPRPPLPSGFHGAHVWESFHAPPHCARRFAVAVADDCEPEQCTRAHGLCVTADGDVLLIQSEDGRWDLPGGGREPGETTVDTFVREVAEEACARAVPTLFVTALRIVELDEHGAPMGEVDVHAQMWARVELDPWDQQFETTARRLVTPDEAVTLTVFPHWTEHLLDRAAAIDPALDWPPEGEL